MIFQSFSWYFEKKRKNPVHHCSYESTVGKIGPWNCSYLRAASSVWVNHGLVHHWWISISFPFNIYGPNDLQNSWNEFLWLDKIMGIPFFQTCMISVLGKLFWLTPEDDIMTTISEFGTSALNDLGLHFKQQFKNPIKVELFWKHLTTFTKTLHILRFTTLLDFYLQNFLEY
jgi:hypothetical protein